MTQQLSATTNTSIEETISSKQEDHRDAAITRVINNTFESIKDFFLKFQKDLDAHVTTVQGLVTQIKLSRIQAEARTRKRQVLKNTQGSNNSNTGLASGNKSIDIKIAHQIYSTAHMGRKISTGKQFSKCVEHKYLGQGKEF